MQVVAGGVAGVAVACSDVAGVKQDSRKGKKDASLQKNFERV